MKIVSIYSEIPNQHLDSVMKIIYKTFNELDVNIDTINLKDLVPFYEGYKVKEVTDIILKIQSADACILASSVNMFLPSSLMKAFLEHCSNKDYQAILNGKNYMTICVSSNIGEREASEYMSKVLGVLGGIELSRISISGRDYALINSDQLLRENIEKNVEDFYRILRQNRRNFIPSESYIYQDYTDNILYPQDKNLSNELLPENSDKEFSEIKTLLNNIRNKSSTLDKQENQLSDNTLKNNIIDSKNKEAKVEAYQAQFEAFTERQEEDIKDITRMFAQKLSSEKEINVNNSAIYTRPLPKQDVVYREKTCRQMMQSLPHHFQSHLAAGIKATFQFVITGDEEFEGYLTIDNSETSFNEGTSENADIYVYISSNIMKDILKGKYSTQKAFMTGQLKVRGNFVLLNKLDQLYRSQ